MTGTEADLVLAGGAAFGGGMMIFQLIVLAAMIAGMWKCFSKAGQPGWAALVPFYNWYTYAKIAKPEASPIIWGVVLMLIPFVNIVIMIMLTHGMSKAYGQGIGFTLGLLFLGPIFYPLLGFGNYQYVGAGAPATPPQPGQQPVFQADPATAQPDQQTPPPFPPQA